jgi:hypothetical protein
MTGSEIIDFGTALLLTYVTPIQYLGMIAMLGAGYLIYRENRRKNL